MTKVKGNIAIKKQASQIKRSAKKVSKKLGYF